MEKKKNTERKMEKKKEEKISCADQFCPIHGKNKAKLRGRTFQGKVIRKFPGRITLSFERVLHDRKYERYEKRTTKLHARLPDCMKEDINVGDYIEIAECRKLSKIIHFIVTKLIRKEGKNESD